MRCAKPSSGWRGVFIVVLILLASLILLYENTKASRCGVVMIVMGILWVTEVVPLPVTALVPVFAFPLLGVLPTGAVCGVYLKDSNMMFLGGLIMAAAVEHCNFHERIALFVIIHVGQSPRLLSLGFTIVTSFLSMWISNTATAAMMVPIVDAVVKELTKLRELEVKSAKQGEEDGTDAEEEEGGQIATDRYLRPGPDGTYIDMHVTKEEAKKDSQADPVVVYFNEVKEEEEDTYTSSKEREVVVKITKTDLEDVSKECLFLRQMLFLSVAFSANTGGTGSPLGCGPNIVLMGMLDSTFNNSMGLNFATWMIYNVPGVILCALLGWLWLQILFMYCGKHRVRTSTLARERALKHFLEGHYRALGPVSRREMVVVISFVTLVMLWVFRDPGFVPGWATFFQMPNEKTSVQAATPVMLIIFLLFCIPATSQPAHGLKTVEKCMTWDAVHKKVPWGIVLLLGGGLALAEGVKKSGLSIYIGEKLLSVIDLPKEALLVLVCLFVAGMTEIASNTATASILLPILADMSMTIKVHPLYLLVPATACCAYAFMLPVATPGNAIILSASGMTTSEMMRAGIVMNFVCVLVSVFLINTLGHAVFDLYTFPTPTNHTAL